MANSYNEPAMQNCSFWITSVMIWKAQSLKLKNLKQHKQKKKNNWITFEYRKQIAQHSHNKCSKFRIMILKRQRCKKHYVKNEIKVQTELTKLNNVDVKMNSTGIEVDGIAYVEIDALAQVFDFLKVHWQIRQWLLTIAIIDLTKEQQLTLYSTTNTKLRL